MSTTKIVASLMVCWALLLRSRGSELDDIATSQSEADLINSLHTDEEFLDFFGIQDPRSGVEQFGLGASNSVHQRSAGNVVWKPRMAVCQPENRTVSTSEGNGTYRDPYVMFQPPCIRVQRCGGCCHLERFSCQPTESETLLVQILGIRHVQDKESREVWKEMRPIEQHLKCACKCKFGPEDCGERQVFVKDGCRCDCTNRDEELKCDTELKEKKRWNATTCSCDCRSQYVRECSTGYYFDENTCACRKLQLFSHWFGGGSVVDSSASLEASQPPVRQNGAAGYYGVSVNDRRVSYNNNNNNNNNGRQRTTDKPPVYVYTFAGADDPRRKHKDDPEY